MKVLGRVVFIEEHGNFIGKRGNSLYVKASSSEIHEVPLGTIEALVIRGNCSISSSLLSELPLFNIVCLFLDWSGKVQTKIDGRRGKNIFLRKHQLKACLDPEFSLEIAKFIVLSKLRSQKTLFPSLNFTQLEMDVQETDSYQQLLGYEGAATREYFSLLREELDYRGFKFYKREFYPATDPSNVLLSIAYTLLMTEVSVICNLFDFDEGWGFLHKDYYGRDSLLCDFIEPFRAPIADQYVLELIDSLKLTEEDFKIVDGRLTIADAEKRRKVFKLFRSSYFTDGMRMEILDWVRSVYDKIISKALSLSQEAA